MILDILSGALAGDPMARQHMAWLLAQPATWLLIAKFGLIVAGVVLVSRQLLLARRFFLLCVFGALCIGGTWLFAGALQQTRQSFADGLGNVVWLTRILALLTDALAIMVAVWIARLLFWRKG